MSKRIQLVIRRESDVFVCVGGSVEVVVAVVLIESGQTWMIEY